MSAMHGTTDHVEARIPPLGRLGGLATVAAAVVLATIPAAVSAQAICSAPHSSPTLVQSGEIRTLGRGSGWIQLSYQGQRATEFFNSTGDRQAFLSGSEFNTQSFFLTAALGLADGLEVWAQLPRHRLSIDASSGVNTSSGVGDVRFAARVGAELFGFDLPVAARVGFKVPGSDFPVDARVLPLTEGQSDFELSLESGSTLGSLPLYVAGWLGYRWRGANTEAARHPGDELFLHFALGGFVGDLTWEVAADGLFAEPMVAQGVELPSEKRRLVQILPTVGYGVGPGRLEVTGQLPVSGRVLPAAVGGSVGYRLGWGL